MSKSEEYKYYLDSEIHKAIIDNIEARLIMAIKLDTSEGSLFSKGYLQSLLDIDNMIQRINKKS